MSSRCNGCFLDTKARQLGDKLLVLQEEDLYASVTLYELDAEPLPDETKKVEHEGRPVRFIAWLMSPGHACGKASSARTVGTDA